MIDSIMYCIPQTACFNISFLVSMRQEFICSCYFLFRLDAWALSVIATATWLAGWLGGWLVVRHTPVLYQNGENYRKTFSNIWKPHHSSFLRPLRRYKIPRETPSAGALNTRGVWKLAIFLRFSTYIAVYLGNGAR